MAFDKVVDSAVLEAGLTAIANAIREKGGTSGTLAFPDGMAEAIAAIEAGGTIRVEQGIVTFAEAMNGYTFVTEEPDVFICYKEDDASEEYYAVEYVWVFVQTYDYQYTFGYNLGSRRYYVPNKSTISSLIGSPYLGKFSSGAFNSKLAPATYRWYAIYGIS